MQKPTLIAALLLCAVLPSCSLKYDEDESSEDDSPELEFTNVDYKKYEDKVMTSEIKADALEQYKSDDTAYAKNASFKSWNKKAELVAEGSCGYLGLDSDKEVYVLFDDIFIDNVEQEFRLEAQSLKWSGKTQMLVSGKEDEVRLERDDVEVTGSGFSASADTRSFEFANPVSGVITTSDDEDEDEGEQEEGGE